jgi:hypothetical protein
MARSHADAAHPSFRPPPDYPGRLHGIVPGRGLREGRSRCVKVGSKRSPRASWTTVLRSCSGAAIAAAPIGASPGEHPHDWSTIHLIGRSSVARGCGEVVLQSRSADCSVPSVAHRTKFSPSGSASAIGVSKKRVGSGCTISSPSVDRNIAIWFCAPLAISPNPAVPTMNPWPGLGKAGFSSDALRRRTLDSERPPGFDGSPPLRRVRPHQPTAVRQFRQIRLRRPKQPVARLFSSTSYRVVRAQPAPGPRASYRAESRQLPGIAERTAPRSRVSWTHRVGPRP